MLAPARHGTLAALSESAPHEEPRAATKRLRNGIDLDQLSGMVEAIRAEPEAGTVIIRSRHRWAGGFAVDGRAEELENAGEVTPRTSTFRTDWPPEAGGRDSGPTPGELLLAALGACLASTYATRAATDGIDIDELEVTLEAPVDFGGLFELAAVRPGLAGVKATVAVRSEAGDAALEALAQSARRTSPVCDTLAGPVAIELSVDRLGSGGEAR